MKKKIVLLWSKCVNPETVSYLICGVLTTIINYVVDLVSEGLLSAAEIPFSASIANIIAWVISVIFAFFANKIYVFKSKVWHGRAFRLEIIAFITARVASLGFETLFIFLTVDLSHLFENWLAKILSNVFVVVMNYFASKFIIFKKKEETNG